VGGRVAAPGKGSYDDRMGFSETIFIFLLALLIFGPKKLPEIGRQIGKALNEFRRASNEFKAQIESEIANLEREVDQPQILPPTPPPAGSIASGTLTDPPVLEGHSEAHPAETPAAHKAADA
jgi:TatA/E family protein of Tat protein translocase